jgi:hypothetical protein
MKRGFDKEGKTMRKILLNLIVPGLVLMCMLTISCKEQAGILGPGGTSMNSDPTDPSNNEYTDFQEPTVPDSGDEGPYPGEDTQSYAMLCAPEYEPQTGTMNWDARDHATQVRIDAGSGGTIELNVETTPNPGMNMTYQVRADIPPEALPHDTTLRAVVPEPGIGAFGLLVAGNQGAAEPFALTGSVYLDFKIQGLDLSGVTSEDLVLLRWNEVQGRWVETSGDVEMRAQTIVGNLELTTLGRFAVGTHSY